MRRSNVLVFCLLATVGAVPLSGCGQARQDAHEKRQNYTVDVVQASFPTAQRVASSGQMVLVVRNSGRHEVPNLAVSIDSFAEQNTQPGLANSQRPVWIVDRGPGEAPSHSVENIGPDIQGGDSTAYTNTWAAGPLAVGATAVLVWKVTPVQSGSHVVRYRVDAGLGGNARARNSSGQPPTGSFRVLISSVPAQAHVDPNTGGVLPGPAPLAGG